MSRTLLLIIALLMFVFAASPHEGRQTDLSGPVGIVKSVGVELPNGPLPDTGYEAITPPARYYDNTMLGLIPADSYGRIWPYIGGWVPSMMGTASELIGICDSGGKIICDPYYNDVKLIERDGEMMYVFIKNNAEIYERHEDYNSFYDRYTSTLAATDGSFAETFEDVKWQSWYYELEPLREGEYASYMYDWRDAIEFDFITARRDGKWGVIGWDGEVLLPFKYLEPVCFSEGLAAVLSDDEQTVSFIDITGQTVLGPYTAPPRQSLEYNYSGEEMPLTSGLIFVEGCARYFENGKYGLIDREGRVVIPAEYDFITSFSGGIAMTALRELPDGKTLDYGRYYGLINDAGAVILEPYDGFIWNGCGYAITYKRGDGTVNEVIAYDGTRMEYADELRYEWRDVNEREIWSGWDMELVSYDDGRWHWPYQYWLKKPDGTRATPDYYYTIIPASGGFAVRGERVAGLIDANGEYVIKVPVAAYSAD